MARVVVGILDPDQRICGRGIRKLRDAGIEVDLFPSDFMAQVEDQNREFIRHRGQIEAENRIPPAVGLTLEKVELDPAPERNIKFKLRMYWLNDGGHVHIGKPTWRPGGMNLQGHELAYRFQVLENCSWGTETMEADLLPDQQFRIYIGLQPDPLSGQLAAQLLQSADLALWFFR